MISPAAWPLAGTLVYLAVLLQGPRQVRGAQGECTRHSFYCEKTDSCGDITNCPVVACPPSDSRYSFSCDNGTNCYSLSDRCDGERKCTDGADELPCEDFTGKTKPCSSWTTACDGGDRCYSYFEKCSGVAFCRDGADEAGCVSCTLFETKCSDNTGCYRTAQRCDTIKDCVNGEDEGYCTKHHGRDYSWESTSGLTSGTKVGIVAIAIVCVMIGSGIKYAKYKAKQDTQRAAYLAVSFDNSHPTPVTSQTRGPQGTGRHLTHSHNRRQLLMSARSSGTRPQHQSYVIDSYPPSTEPLASSNSSRGSSTTHYDVHQQHPPHPPPTPQPAPSSTDESAPPPSYESLFGKHE